MLLAGDFLKRMCDQLGKGRLVFSDEARLAIQNYHWPGNVRELENAIERAVILCEKGIINPELLAIDAFTPTQMDRMVEPQVDSATTGSLENYFQQFVLDNQDHMTETELASKLGISRKNLWERRQRLNIPRQKPRRS